jgi:hypothetical protein
MHGPIEMQRGAGCIGAGVHLIPHGALDEVDRLGLTQHGGRPTHPQQLTFGVTDGHDAIAVLRRSTQNVIEQREDPR